MMQAVSCSGLTVYFDRNSGIRSSGTTVHFRKNKQEERDIIERLYFNDETVRSVAKLKSITHPALIKRRNKILEKLKKFIEEL